MVRNDDRDIIEAALDDADRPPVSGEPTTEAVDAVAAWLHRNAATRRNITCGPDSTGCRVRHRLDAQEILTEARTRAEPPQKIPDWCALIGTFMGQPQYCGEPAASAWHQPGEWFKHEFVPLTLTPTPAEPLDVGTVEQMMDFIINLHDCRDPDMGAPCAHHAQERRIAVDAAYEAARLRPPEADR